MDRGRIPCVQIQPNMIFPLEGWKTKTSEPNVPQDKLNKDAEESKTVQKAREKYPSQEKD